MKKQSSFALFLLIVAAIAIAVLVAGVFGLQRLYTLTVTARADYQKEVNDCNSLTTALGNESHWRTELKGLDVTLASLDTNLVDYKYIPSYLEQIQQTAAQTGNIICSIRPRPVAVLDTNNPLIKASNDQWQKKFPEIAEAAQYVRQAPKTRAAPGTEPKKNDFRIEQFTLEIQGSYPSVMQFLDALSKFPKLVYVHSVAIAPLNQLKPDELKATIETYAIITPEQYQPETTSEVGVNVAKGSTP